VLGFRASPGSEIKAEALTVDQNGDDEKERIRILRNHPSSEANTLFAGGRLFGHTAVTRCRLTDIFCFGIPVSCD
jgi:hypothetical protein